MKGGLGVGFLVLNRSADVIINNAWRDVKE